MDMSMDMEKIRELLEIAVEFKLKEVSLQGFSAVLSNESLKDSGHCEEESPSRQATLPLMPATEPEGHSYDRIWGDDRPSFNNE